MLSKQEIAALRLIQREHIPNGGAVISSRDLSALLDIAEAVANGLTCEVRECCGHVIIGNEWDDDDATNKLIGKRVAVLPLAGE